MPPLRTVLVGFGRVAAGYATDAKMAEHYRYITHAQVLRDHPGFQLIGVADPDPDARKSASETWKVPHVASSASELAADCDAEVLVLATPPETRSSIISLFPHLRGLLIEKPVAYSTAEGKRIRNVLSSGNITTCVNLWRRADEFSQGLAQGRLGELIGNVQAVQCLYGNGLMNCGIHLIDQVRWLLGKVDHVRALGTPLSPEVPAPLGDINLSFVMTFQSGIQATFTPLDFRCFRENSLDFIGTSGRLCISLEGLSNRCWAVAPHRAMDGTQELPSEYSKSLESTAGHAYYRLYTNLADSISGLAAPCCTIEEAIQTEEIARAVLLSADRGGAAVVPGEPV